MPARAGVTQSVHIVPIAREIDRVVLPFLAHGDRPPLLHAHRVILVRGTGEPSRRVAEKIERSLRRVAVVEHEVLQEPSGARDEFEGVLERLAILCARERTRGNRISINLSGGTKLFALAAGLAGMAHLPPGQGAVYYVRPSGYLVTEAEFEEHGISKGMLDVEEVQLMPLLLPDPLQQRVLCFLKQRPFRSAEYRELLAFLNRIPDSGFSPPSVQSLRRVRAWKNATTTRMVRSILTPLQQQGLVELRDVGRKRGAMLTRRGAMYAALVGIEPESLLVRT